MPVGEVGEKLKLLLFLENNLTNQVWILKQILKMLKQMVEAVKAPDVPDK